MHTFDETAQLQPEQAPGNRQSRLLWEAAACTGRQKSLADSVTPVHCSVYEGEPLNVWHLCLWHCTGLWTGVAGAGTNTLVGCLCGGADLSQEWGRLVGRALSETLVMQEVFFPYLRLQKLQTWSATPCTVRGGKEVTIIQASTAYLITPRDITCSLTDYKGIFMLSTNV